MTDGSNGYRLLVFDWDGTLIDSIGTIVACTRETLTELGLPEQDGEIIRRAIGLGLRETVDLIHPGCSDETFDDIVRVYRRLWLEDYGHRSPLFDGARGQLAKLARDGYLLAIATAKGRLGLDLDLQRLGMNGAFHATRTATEAPAKPDPAMLLELMAELEVAPADTLMIGDSVHDLETARNAGVASVGVTTGAHGRDDLLEIGPLACLGGVVELRSWLRAGRAASALTSTESEAGQ